MTFQTTMPHLRAAFCLVLLLGAHATHMTPFDKTVEDTNVDPLGHAGALGASGSRPPVEKFSSKQQKLLNGVYGNIKNVGEGVYLMLDKTIFRPTTLTSGGMGAKGCSQPSLSCPEARENDIQRYKFRGQIVEMTKDITNFNSLLEIFMDGENYPVKEYCFGRQGAKKLHALLWVKLGKGDKEKTVIIDNRRDPVVKMGSKCPCLGNVASKPMWRVRELKARPNLNGIKPKANGRGGKDCMVTCGPCYTKGWVKPFKTDISLANLYELYNQYCIKNEVVLTAIGGTCQSCFVLTNKCAGVMAKVCCFPCRAVSRLCYSKSSVNCYHGINFMLYYLKNGGKTCWDKFIKNGTKDAEFKTMVDKLPQKTRARGSAAHGRSSESSDDEPNLKVGDSVIILDGHYIRCQGKLLLRSGAALWKVELKKGAREVVYVSPGNLRKQKMYTAKPIIGKLKD